MSLERPRSSEFRRQMARAQQEAAAARFWFACTRLVLGGVVAVMTGALAGATLWVFVGEEPNLARLGGPTLVTAGGGAERNLRIPPPAVRTEIPGRSLAEAPVADLDLPPAAAPAERGAAPEARIEIPPEAQPESPATLVPEADVRLSWMEEPPLEAEEGHEFPGGTPGLGEQLAEGSGQPLPDDLTPAAAKPDSPAPTADLFRKRTPGEIDAGLAALDLDLLSPEDVSPAAARTWQRYAVPVSKPFDRPVIAIVIDDLGLNRPNTRRTIALPGPLTLAVMTYANDPQALADNARAAGHELLVHMPMAPRDPRYNPGPNVLRDDLGREELARRIAWGLSRFEGYVGINNHMGSRFTTSIPGMAQVMMELKARGLLYLDSLTVPGTVGAALADRVGVPFARRDVFIDNEPESRESIRRQLQRLERIALRTGRAVGIGHPHDSTLDELEAWLPKLKSRGFQLVPISALVLTPSGIAVTPGGTNPPG